MVVRPLRSSLPYRHNTPLAKRRDNFCCLIYLSNLSLEGPRTLYLSLCLGCLCVSLFLCLFCFVLLVLVSLFLLFICFLFMLFLLFLCFLVSLFFCFFWFDLPWPATHPEQTNTHTHTNRRGFPAEPPFPTHPGIEIRRSAPPRSDNTKNMLSLIHI